MSDKLFLCQWGGRGSKKASVGALKCGTEHFKSYRQYTDDDISAILSLMKNEEWFDTEKRTLKLGTHSVKRIR
jgi:hypothetical protein